MLGSSVLDAAAAQGMMERPLGRSFLVAAGEAEERRRGSTKGMVKVRALGGILSKYNNER